MLKNSSYANLITGFIFITIAGICVLYHNWEEFAFFGSFGLLNMLICVAINANNPNISVVTPVIPTPKDNNAEVSDLWKPGDCEYTEKSSYDPFNYKM